MKLTKLTNFLVISSLLTISCSQEKPMDQAKTNEGIAESKREEAPQIFSLWEQLTKGENGNLALSEYLAKSVFQEDKSYISKNIPALSLDEIDTLINQVEINSRMTKTDFLYYGSIFKNDQSFLSQTILKTKNDSSSADSFEQQFLINAASKIKTDLLKNILSIYDQRISENSDLIADYILKDISDNNPELKAKLEETAKNTPSKLNELITKTLPTIQKVDSLFKSSGLNNDEQVMTIAIGVVGSKIYTKIKDKKTFQEILKTYNAINDVVKKAKEVTALLTGINDYQKEMKQDLKDFGSAMKGLAHDSSDLLNKSSSYDPSISGKKIQNFLYESVIKGNPKANGEANASILSKQISLNQNFVTAINKAEKLNNNFNTILNSAEAIAKILHIELPSGVKKALETTKKASALFSTVNKTIQGLKSGGVMGALSALSSGPAMGMLGLDADPDAVFKGEVLAQLGVINQKLDEVLDLQRQTIKIQLETMSMIKEMALMIDSYHRDEMDLLSDVRDTTLTILETNKIALNSNLRACEILLNYQLNSNPSLMMYKISAYEDMRSLDLDIQKFKNSLNSYKDIYRMVNSSGGTGFESCQVGLNQAFGLINVNENPIRAIFSSNENENLFKFQREKYFPLYKLLKSTKKPSVLYHLPVANFSSLFQKYTYLKSEGSSFANYSMEDFISTRALERNTASLLVFYPFIDLDLNEWKSGLTNVLQLSINNLDAGKNSRAYYLLRNNLALIQTAIAEEALLSGELVFDELQANQDLIFQDNVNSSKELSYAVLGNRLMMKNFIKYLIIDQINENPSTLNKLSYSNAFEVKDLAGVAQFFKNETIQKNIGLDKEARIVLKFKIDGVEQNYPIPSLADIQDDQISYSENMYRLLELQKRVVEALIKVSPNNFSEDQKNQLGRMLIYL